MGTHKGRLGLSLIASRGVVCPDRRGVNIPLQLRDLEIGTPVEAPQRASQRPNRKLSRW